MSLAAPENLKQAYLQEDSKNLEAYYGLPAEVKFCKRCVISNQRPSSTVEFKSTAGVKKETIAFDADGICAACRYSDIKEKEINWRQREEELIRLCNHYRSKQGNYDCVVPGSGGKDSAFTSHILKSKYGMNPLTVTWTPHMYTDIGFGNLQRWVHSGLDNILFSPNGRVHRLLTRLAFEKLMHPFQPFIIGQRHIAPKISSLYGVPLVFYGENQAEYGNNIQDNFKPTMDPKFFEGETDPSKIMLGGVSGAELIKNYGVTLNELNAYFPADKEKLKATGTTVHYLGYYLKWDPQECYYYAAEHTGFVSNDERTEGSYSKYSSIDDKIDPLHYYTTYIKFGIGRATYDASQEIRNKKITREEGAALVKRFDSEYPKRFETEVLRYLSIENAEFPKASAMFGRPRMDAAYFHELTDRFRSPHLWRHKNGQWQIRHAVWMDK